jgi:hypothetical protein
MYRIERICCACHLKGTKIHEDDEVEGWVMFAFRAYGPKSVILAIFSGIAKPKSPHSLHNFLTAID